MKKLLQYGILKLSLCYVLDLGCKSRKIIILNIGSLKMTTETKTKQGCKPRPSCITTKGINLVRGLKDRLYYASYN